MNGYDLYEAFYLNCKVEDPWIRGWVGQDKIISIFPSVFLQSIISMTFSYLCSLIIQDS